MRAATQAGSRFSPEPTQRLATVPAGLVHRVQRRLAAEQASPEPANLVRAVRAESAELIDDARMLSIIRFLEQELTGAGPLAALLDDPDTTDVVVNAPDDVRVDRGNGWEHSDVTFPDDESVQRLARRLASMVGARLDDAHPYVDGRLPDGTRLHAILPPLARRGACLSLRVLRPGRYDLAALRERNLFPGITYPALSAILAARLAFVISGGTGSGKTTLLGAMLGAVDPAERIVTVEDAEELQPAHPHLVRLIARSANVEGVGAVSLQELVRQALRMRPDRVVLGEVRGAEVVDLIGALSTGHEGGAGTVHANSARDVPARLTALGAIGGLAREALHAQLAGAIDVTIHVRRRGAVRSVTEIAVLEASESGMVHAVSAIVDGAPTPEGGPLLALLLTSRGCEVPW